MSVYKITLLGAEGPLCVRLCTNEPQQWCHQCEQWARDCEVLGRFPWGKGVSMEEAFEAAKAFMRELKQKGVA